MFHHAEKNMHQIWMTILLCLPHQFLDLKFPKMFPKAQCTAHEDGNSVIMLRGIL